ncbi:hypothetical protein FB451DRAFT_1221588 [Mycena latifolia]|nr:hypothetical protein FB451DRAFT_1221588 [Mycena latifolia]
MTGISRVALVALILGPPLCFVVLCCLPFHLYDIYNRRRRSPRQHRPPLNPPPLPLHRIDIRRRRLGKQPLTCHFLKLPPELRQCIYAVALGGRVVALRLVASASRIKSTCHEPAGYAGNGPTRLDVPAEKIPIALLFSCRQVYLEALPVLHQHNTFHFQVDEFEVVFLAALGRYCLPDIRSVYLCRTYHSFGVPKWSSVFELLQRMGLHSLIFEFTARADEWKNLERDLQLDRSCRVVKIRNLHRLEVFFKDYSLEPAEPRHLASYTENVGERLRDLMIGARGDERYRTLLEEREEEIKLARHKGGILATLRCCSSFKGRSEH